MIPTGSGNIKEVEMLARQVPEFLSGKEISECMELVKIDVTVVTPWS